MVQASVAAALLLLAGCGGTGALTGPAAARPADITVEGASNVRDLGGHTTAQGSTVVKGRIFRSSSLHRVTEAGVRQLADLHLATVVDFRGQAEAAPRVDHLPAGVTSIPSPVPGAMAAGPPAPASEPDPAMVNEFRHYVTDNSARAAFGSALRALAAADKPMLWHCNSGTFRTGWASAILLTALGVPRDQVVADFLRSNAAYGGTFAFAEYLDAAFAEADKEFGSFTGFLEQGLGVDAPTLARLRQALLA